MDTHRFDRALPMALLRAREAVMKGFVTTLKEYDMSPQQWRVIRTLQQDNGVEMSELSKRCFLLKPSMTRIVQNLEERNYISRQKANNDQRKCVLFLTEKGYSLCERVAPKSLERYEYIAQKFGQSKLSLLHELLEDLVDCLEETSNTK